MNCAQSSLWYYPFVYTFIFLDVFKGPDNFIDSLSDNVHSCSWQGMATASLTPSDQLALHVRISKTLTATVIVDVID